MLTQAIKQEYFKSFILALVLLVLFPLHPASAFIPGVDDFLWGGHREDFQEATGLGSEDPRIIIANIVNVLLEFLGILAVLIILLGGFKFMLSGGDETKTAEARRTITSGIVGIIIILASFGLARFVLEALYEATT